MREREIVNGRFEIERRAGAGGMGTVFRAMDRQTGVPVALKVLNAGHSPELAERFQREAALLAELRHPGIVRFVASGATPDGQAYLVMEWLEGEGLVDRLARGTLSVAETIDLGQKLAAALSVAHARGVIHRDLKPGNIFLPGRDLARVVILDFGIARAVESGQSLTSTGATLGSPGYLSPEQARGDSNLDTRADVFSLGCVLFRCLTGQAPFAGDLIQVMMRTVLEPAPLVGSLREGIPAELEALIQRMLAKSPDARPRDAAAVFTELGALVTMGPRAAPNPGPSPRPVPSGARITAHGTVAIESMPQPPSPLASRSSSRPPPSLAPVSARMVAGPPSAPPQSVTWPMTPGAPPAPPPAFAPAPMASPHALQAPAPVLPQAPIPSAPPAPQRSRFRRWAIAAVGVTLLAAGAAALFLSYGDELFGSRRPPVPAAKHKSR